MLIALLHCCQNLCGFIARKLVKSDVFFFIWTVEFCSLAQVTWSWHTGDAKAKALLQFLRKVVMLHNCSDSMYASMIVYFFSPSLFLNSLHHTW